MQAVDGVVDSVTIRSGFPGQVLFFGHCPGVQAVLRNIAFAQVFSCPSQIDRLAFVWVFPTSIPD